MGRGLPSLLLAASVVLGATTVRGAAVEPGQTWRFGSGVAVRRGDQAVVLRAGDEVNVLQVEPPWVACCCRRGEAVTDGRLPLAAFASALTAGQFETLRAAMSTYVYSDDEAARRTARETIAGFGHAAFDLQEVAASRVHRHVADPPSAVQRLTLEVGDGVEGEYYLLLPRGYDPSKRYPLIVSFHQTGDTGKYYAHWILGNTPADSSFIVVAPTSTDPERRTWWRDESGELIEAALRDTNRDYSVDPWRVYAEGFSMGGVATTFWSQTWPDRFAAIGPQATCCWRNPRDIAGSLENVRLVPAFLAVGEDDMPANVRAFRRLDEGLTRLKTPHVFRLVAGRTHSIDSLEADLLAFLSRYERNLFPRAIAYNIYEFEYGRRMPEWVYWLRLREASHKARIEARVQGNTIQITTTRVRRFDVYLSDRLVDIDKPVTVIVNRRNVHMGMVERSIFTTLDVIRETGDPARLFSAKVEVFVH